MGVLESLVELYQTNLPRAIGVTLFELLVLCSIVWVSICDIRSKKIKFWKMLIAGASILTGPTIMSLFYNCSEMKTMKMFIPFSWLIWLVLLYLNIHFNKDRFMGKADIDLLSAVFALGLTFSVWSFNTGVEMESSVSAINVTTFWYRCLGYTLLGALVYLVIFTIVAIYKIGIKKVDRKKWTKDTRISVIPMFLPLCMMAPYLVMIP